MAELGILGQRHIEGVGRRQYVVSQVRHDGGLNTFEIDQTATQVQVFVVDGQAAPTVTIEAAGDSVTFLKTVTISGGGSGLLDVWTYHGIAVGSSK